MAYNLGFRRKVPLRNRFLANLDFDGDKPVRWCVEPPEAIILRNPDGGEAAVAELVDYCVVLDFATDCDGVESAGLVVFLWLKLSLVPAHPADDGCTFLIPWTHCAVEV